MGYGRKIMEKCRVTAGLQTIPRLRGVMSRKDQHAQTSCHQPGILATLGHTEHVPLLPRHSVHQGVKASLLQEDLGLPDNQIMELLVAVVVTRHIALVEHILLSSHRDSFHLPQDLQVDLQVDLQDMGLEYPLGLAVAPKDLDHQCRMGALDHQGIMKVLDHLGKMGDMDRLDKGEAWDHQGIMGDLVHQGIMVGLVYLVKMAHLDHLGKVEALEYRGIKEDQAVTLDTVRVEDPIIRELFMGEIMHMGDLAPLLQEQDQEQDQANMALKEAIAIKVDKVMVVISMGWLSLDRDVTSLPLHSVFIVAA